jgi:hypothetical protein
MLDSHAERLSAALTAKTSLGSGRDFSRIPIHSPATPAIREKPGVDPPLEPAPRLLGATWDFSKIPLYPQARRVAQERPSLAPVPSLPGPIQRKLKIGAIDDPVENEADRVADQVMRMPAPNTVTSSVTPQVSRKCDKCEAEEKLQKKETGPQAAAGEAPASVHEALGSPGQPLDSATRAYMEPRFDYDFSHVRIHIDPRAQQSARDVNALAYTVGANIAFAAGQYAPHATEGRQLIAHELAHVVQQGIGGPPPGIRHELEASSLAQRIDAGANVAVSAGSAIGLAREPHPALTVPLTWDELFHKVISDQRAFLLTRPSEANNPAIDPAGVGRGVGPDRTVKGLEVLAAIQVVDKSGKRVAIGFGAHVLLPGEHGEEQALAGLRSAIPANQDLHGGEMMVVVDQFPCGQGRHECGQQLRDFARARGLKLVIKVPIRERINQPGVDASPRTASRGAYRTDLSANPRTAVQLRTIEEISAPEAAGGGGSGTPAAQGRGTPAIPDRGETPAGAKPGGGDTQLEPQTRYTAPGVTSSSARSSSPDAAKILAGIEGQLERGRQFNARLGVYLQAYNAYQSLMGFLDSADTMLKVLSTGTADPEGQRQADLILAQSKEAPASAMDYTRPSIDQIFHLYSIEDSHALSLIARTTGGFSTEQRERVRTLRRLASDLRDRSNEANRSAILLYANALAQQRFETASAAAQIFNGDAVKSIAATLSNASDNYAKAAQLAESTRSDAEFIANLCNDMLLAGFNVPTPRCTFLHQNCDQELEQLEQMRQNLKAVFSQKPVERDE